MTDKATPLTAKDTPVEMWTDANKLRLLALWFDKWDVTDYADRQALLDEGPGRDEVQRDLRSIADRLDAARQPAPSEGLREAAQALVDDHRRLGIWRLPRRFKALAAALDTRETSE